MVLAIRNEIRACFGAAFLDKKSLESAQYSLELAQKNIQMLEQKLGEVTRERDSKIKECADAVPVFRELGQKLVELEERLSALHKTFEQRGEALKHMANLCDAANKRAEKAEAERDKFKADAFMLRKEVATLTANAAGHHKRFFAACEARDAALARAEKLTDEYLSFVAAFDAWHSDDANGRSCEEFDAVEAAREAVRLRGAAQRICPDECDEIACPCFKDHVSLAPKDAAGVDAQRKVEELQTELSARPVAVPAGDRMLVLHDPGNPTCPCAACMRSQSLPYAIPPAVLAVVDAAKAWRNLCSASTDNTLAKSVDALSAAPYRCVQGWVEYHEVNLINVRGKFGTIRFPKDEMIPVTICYPAPKGGEK